MARSRGRRPVLLAGGLVLLAGLGTVGILLARATSAPKGPQPIVWNQEACAHCAMHIGEPRFAAQLLTTDDRVLNFDDPGCLLLYRAEHPATPRAVYFRDHGADAWLGADEVSLVPGHQTPMGFGFVARPRGTPGGVDLPAATAAVSRAAAAPAATGPAGEHAP